MKASKIESLPNLTKPHIAALKKLGIQTAQDLLLFFPRKYLDFSSLTAIKHLVAGQPVTVQAKVTSIASRFSFRSRMSVAEAIVSDGSGSLRVVWFNQGYLAKSLAKGEEFFLSGTPEYYKGVLQLTNPVHEKASEFPLHTSRIVPVYSLPEKLYPKTFRNIISKALSLASTVHDPLPKSVLARQHLPKLADCLHQLHFPSNFEQLRRAKTRLAFEEIFTNQLLAQKHKLELEKKQSHVVKFDEGLVKKFLSQLPFELTPGQKRAAWDILQDIEKPRPMNRLLEGDVGSGKTLVALIAALEAALQGFQVALLSPTEILARQHFETAQKYFPILGAKAALLTAHYSLLDSGKTEKRKLQKLIAEGMPALYIGTHALLQEKVSFPGLSLVIVDEQHRFGVEQRASLMSQKGKVPHLLSLSATPIPRTLQLAYYGELDISQIKTKPAGRKPIATKLVENSQREGAYEFVRQQLKEGRQAFVITPLIEESEKLEAKAASTEAEALKKVFPEFTLGLMHGRLKGAEKEKVMRGFLENETQILVSTSVVEVGVDVPNASVMLIEGAERFGLAQLHQFRGRVGRSSHQSYCLLFTEKEDEEVLERLKEFSKTHDGFTLAELDLKIRGFGELYGQLQSGWNFKYFNPSYVSLIPPAREESLKLLQEDFELNGYPELKEKIQGKVIHFE